MREHRYSLTMTWTGNLGTGTSAYRAYSRAHDISANGKPPIPGSSDPAFRGDTARYSPEEMLVASLSSCHMLWYLHLCADAGLCVDAYVDEPLGTMVEGADGGGRFTGVELRPRVRFRSPIDTGLAERLHHRAHELCFVANSMNFPVRVAPSFETALSASPPPQGAPA